MVVTVHIGVYMKYIYVYMCVEKDAHMYILLLKVRGVFKCIMYGRRIMIFVKLIMHHLKIYINIHVCMIYIRFLK